MAVFCLRSACVSIICEVATFGSNFEYRKEIFKKYLKTKKQKNNTHSIIFTFFLMATSGESVDVKCTYRLQPQILGNNLLGLNKKKKKSSDSCPALGNKWEQFDFSHDNAQSGIFWIRKTWDWKLNCQCWEVWDCEDQKVFNQCVRLVLERGRKQIALEGQNSTKHNCSVRTEEGGCRKDRSWMDRWRTVEEKKKKKELAFPT